MKESILPKIWLSSPHMGGKELQYIQEAFDSNWIAPIGPHIDNFEKALSHYLDVPHTVVLSSGTAALHLALIMLAIKKDDIVLCQSFTFAASANPILYQGGIPVFIDSEPETWNICPDALETAIKNFIRKGKKPKAIVLVHLYGMPAKMDEIISVANRYGIPIIEDAAEALGSKYKGKNVGSFGEMGILSFNGNKIITTSGGGALTSHSQHFIAKAAFLATQSRDPAPHYEHSQVGYNYRMSNICAGIGLGQMEVLDAHIARRRFNFEFYKNQLLPLPGINFLAEPEGHYSNRWLTTISIDPAHSNGIDREIVRKKLLGSNIESRPVWKPMHQQPLFSYAPYFGGNVAAQIFENGLCLPSGSNLTSHDLQRIVKTIKSTWQ